MSPPNIVDRMLRNLTRSRPPAGFSGELQPGERVVEVADIAEGGHLVLTPLGVWIPDEGGTRRIGWHLVSKAVWDGSALSITEAVSAGMAGEAVVLHDRPPRRYTLPEPGRVPQEIRERVTKSILTSQHVDLPGGGGARFVQRKVPGQDGVVLQVRPDPGTSGEAVRRVARRVAERLLALTPPG